MRKVHPSHSERSSLDIARLAGQAALDKKAEDVVILDVRGISSFADYFVIMSGRSTRHVQGLAGAVEESLRNKKVKGVGSEGLTEGVWVLLDYGDVVVHIFYAGTREFYNLEGLWHDAPRMTLEHEGFEKEKGE